MESRVYQVYTNNTQHREVLILVLMESRVYNLFVSLLVILSIWKIPKEALELQ